MLLEMANFIWWAKLIYYLSKGGCAFLRAGRVRRRSGGARPAERAHPALISAQKRREKNERKRVALRQS